MTTSMETMENERQEYNLYFKLAYTCQTKTYRINTNWTIKEFLDYVRLRTRRDFDFNDNDIIDIVEAGHPDNCNGNDAELAPAIDDSTDDNNNITVKAKFTNQTAFYVRKHIN